MLATATAPPVAVVALRVAFGGFATRESSCTSTAPLTIAAAADVTSIGAGIDDLARSKPVTVVRPNSAVCLVSSAGTAATAATDVTYVDKTPGSISTPSTASSIARVAAADTASIAPALTSRRSFTSAAGIDDLSVLGVLSAAAAVTAAAARMPGSPTRNAVSSARFAAFVSSPRGVLSTRTVPSTRLDAPCVSVARAMAKIRA